MSEDWEPQKVENFEGVAIAVFAIGLAIFLALVGLAKFSENKCDKATDRVDECMKKGYGYENCNKLYGDRECDWKE